MLKCTSRLVKEEASELEDKLVMEHSTEMRRPMASGLWHNVTSFKIWGVVVLTLLIFAIFRNPIVWILHIFLTLSGDFCQNSWNQFIDLVGDDLFTLWFYGLIVVFNATYWVLGGLFTLMDVTLSPETLRKYKTQPGTNEPVDKKRLTTVLVMVAFNQFAIGVPLFYCVSRAMVWRTASPVRDLPSFSTMIFSMVVIVLVEEVVFYYSHRILHNRHLYRHIHKRHHEWTAPIALTATYCHPIEHIVSNSLPGALGVFIVGAHVSTAWIVASVFIVASLTDHCGYHLPFWRSPEFHDFHHLKFICNFGVLGILDWAHGTDSQFVSAGYSRRHKMLLSLTPMRELVPLESVTGKI